MQLAKTVLSEARLMANTLGSSEQPRRKRGRSLSPITAALEDGASCPLMSLLLLSLTKMPSGCVRVPTTGDLDCSLFCTSAGGLKSSSESVQGDSIVGVRARPRSAPGWPSRIASNEDDRPCCAIAGSRGTKYKPHTRLIFTDHDAMMESRAWNAGWMFGMKMTSKILVILRAVRQQYSHHPVTFFVKCQMRAFHTTFSNFRVFPSFYYRHPKISKQQSSAISTSCAHCA